MNKVIIKHSPYTQKLIFLKRFNKFIVAAVLGEIHIDGDLIYVSGLRYKVMAARKAKIKKV